MKRKWSIWLGSAIVLLGGCRSAVNSTEPATPAATPQVVAEKQVLADPTLRRKVAIVQVNEGTVSSDMKKVQVVLQNRKSYTVEINYAFDWFDDNGMLLNRSTDWKPLVLAGKERKAVTAVAPSPRAADFQFKMQEPRPFLKRNKLNPFTP